MDSFKNPEESENGFCVFYQTDQSKISPWCVKETEEATYNGSCRPVGPVRRQGLPWEGYQGSRFKPRVQTSCPPRVSSCYSCKHVFGRRKFNKANFSWRRKLLKYVKRNCVQRDSRPKNKLEVSLQQRTLRLYLAGHAGTCWKVRKVHQFVSRYDMFFNLAFKMLLKETTKTEQIKTDCTIFQ